MLHQERSRTRAVDESGENEWFAIGLVPVDAGLTIRCLVFAPELPLHESCTGIAFNKYIVLWQ